MRRFSALLVLLLGSLPILAGTGPIRESDNPVPGRYIVVLEDSAAPGDFVRDEILPLVTPVAREIVREHGGQLDEVYDAALKGFSLAATREQAEAILSDPRVRYVEEDGVVSAFYTTQTNATWGLDRVDQRDLPLNGTYRYNVNGTGVSVYIIDTGIRITHTDFGGRAKSGYTAINDGRGTNDCNGHGTHVSGTVGGRTYGIAKGVTLYAVRVLNCSGSGTISGVISGVNWVTNNAKKPAVANMSLGGSPSTSLDDAVRNSIAKGITYAVAAGNDGTSACYSSPARVKEAITVAATDSGDAEPYWSNYGTCVDVYAPGNSITSDYYTTDSATRTMSGTSMSSPHVAGAAALYLQTHTSASPAQVSSAITSNATTGHVRSIGPGSPNLLLYTFNF